MLSFTSKTTTLLAYITFVLSVISVVDGLQSPAHKREHVELKRFIKKRAPQIIPIIGAAPIPSDEPSNASELASSALPSESVSISVSISASDSASISQSSGSVLPSESLSESLFSSSLPPSSTPSSPPAAFSTPAPPPPQRSTVTQSGQTKTMTASVDREEPSAPPSMSGASQEAQNKSNIITILIGVLASVGGVFILWTVFRKWKLGSSKRFDKRLQPVGWDEKPGNMDDDIIPANRRHSGSSNHSGKSNVRSNAGFGHGFDHDFTAGPSHLSPVGGYADMARGSTPSPIAPYKSGHAGRY